VAVKKGADMKVVCKKCNGDFNVEMRKKVSCPSCGEDYDLKTKNETFDIKMLNGVVISNLKYDEVKEGIFSGRFLSVDYITGSNLPWLKLKDSEFNSFFNIPLEAPTSKKGKSTFYLLLLSLTVNVLLLFFIYIQKLKIDSLMGN
jgi:hypothetical protein